MKQLTEKVEGNAIEGEFIAADEWESKGGEKEFRDANESALRNAAMAQQSRAQREFRQQAASNNAMKGIGVGGWPDCAAGSWISNLFHW